MRDSRDGVGPVRTPTLVEDAVESEQSVVEMDSCPGQTRETPKHGFLAHEGLEQL